MNKEHLKQMADLIETVPPKKFNMRVCRTGSERTIECKSVGCVIGHCTVLDAENIKKNYLCQDGTIRFGVWSKDFTETTDDEWYWCFSGDWAYIDNTPTGAAKRIRYLVEHGLPEDWGAQMCGRAPLCY